MKERIALLCLLACLVSSAETEFEACARLAEKYQATTEYRLPDQSRVDLLSEEIAWEVDWAYKWPEAVGQALYYAIWTERKGGVILLTRGYEDKHFILRAKIVCEKVGLILRIEETM
jgi:hypothetical protein